MQSNHTQKHSNQISILHSVCERTRQSWLKPVVVSALGPEEQQHPDGYDMDGRDRNREKKKALIYPRRTKDTMVSMLTGCSFALLCACHWCMYVLIDIWIIVRLFWFHISLCSQPYLNRTRISGIIAEVDGTVQSPFSLFSIVFFYPHKSKIV